MERLPNANAFEQINNHPGAKISPTGCG